MAIHAVSNETRTQWDKGGFQVMLKTEVQTEPFGFCDGSDDDERELVSMAEREGADVEIQKRSLKTGRQVWTVRTLSC